MPTRRDALLSIGGLAAGTLVVPGLSLAAAPTDKTDKADQDDMIETDPSTVIDNEAAVSQQLRIQCAAGLTLAYTYQRKEDHATFRPLLPSEPTLAGFSGEHVYKQLHNYVTELHKHYKPNMPSEQREKALNDVARVYLMAMTVETDNYSTIEEMHAYFETETTKDTKTFLYTDVFSFKTNPTHTNREAQKKATKFVHRCHEYFTMELD